MVPAARSALARSADLVITSTGEQLGNFPQVFTHLALINAAATLDRERDRQEDLQSRLGRW